MQTPNVTYRVAPAGLAEKVASCTPTENHKGLVNLIRSFGGLEDAKIVSTVGDSYPVYVRNRGWLQMLDKICEQVPDMEAHLQRRAAHGGPIEVGNALAAGFREMTGSAGTDVAASSHFLALLKDYRDRHGALIEVADALEAMLLASGLDDQLPMSLMALPYPTQYVCFGPAARA
ncbi:hypothetical protein [Polaromonas sp. JS666]|uniref:hypothetical protein n=1 Tax=Polaromonas sp. (strain JS666 / ATCC BAA-500) TaxID=296591 RepID=UPI00005383F7|nr:hypothetical protein [Polaromonas sp. JS666]ABE47338.1 hypothetical protein Bpro_5484 [Polaromonas sp. JS666]